MTIQKQNKPQLVLIGNGMAGMRTIEELLQLAPDKYDITVIGQEPYGNYNRILLSLVLAGEKQIDDIIIHDKAWYRQHHITLHSDLEVVEIDRVNKRVVTAMDEVIAYDKLIIATGSTPVILPLPGRDLPGVISFRDIDDVHRMLSGAKTGRHAVVIGGGLLGLEAANGLALQGMTVSVVHLTDTLMEQQLDKQASDLMRQALEKKGLRFYLSHQTAAIMGTEKVDGVRFHDGTEIAADLVVMAVGIRPNTLLAKQAGIYVEKGIMVDDTLQTYDPNIYAVGECIQHRGAVFGLVAPLYEQAKVCANHLAEWGAKRYVTPTLATQLKVTGIKVFSAGNFKESEQDDVLTLIDRKRQHYKKIVIREQRVIGVVLYGDTQDGPWYVELINDETDISAWRSVLVLGKAFCLLPEKEAS